MNKLRGMRMNCIYEGKPVDVLNRVEKEIKVYDYLDLLGVSYCTVDHEPLTTMEACQEVDRILGVRMCKNLFLCNTQKTNFYLLMMPGEKKFVTKDLSKQLGTARLSFASADSMEEFLNISPGAVSVMGLMNDMNHRVQLVIDQEIIDCEYVACHPCVNTSSIKLATKDILQEFLPSVAHDPIIVRL